CSILGQWEISKLSFQADVIPSKTEDFASSHDCFNGKDNDRPDLSLAFWMVTAPQNTSLIN
ncbi:MAG: hypothetical protein O3B69_04695, partial [Proteobacteria bacterium]|nr:hypothetical protein [Pseudomonadota bacterium]